MGLFDTIKNVRIKCPRCGDEEPKSVQIKSGPKRLDSYEFKKDKIDIDWDYNYYGSIIDREKRIIRGIATCNKCREESDKKIGEIIEDIVDNREIKIPEGDGPKYLISCEIGEENALKIVLNRLKEVYGGNRNIELFDVAIWLDKDYIPMAADPIVKMNE